MELRKHDDCLWLIHLPGALQAHLASTPREGKAALLINDVTTEWRWMRTGRDGRATQGFTISAGKGAWKEIPTGSKFQVKIPDASIVSPPDPACVSPEHPDLISLIQEVKRHARRYKELTGRPLGVTGEIAEYEAARVMGATLCPPREAGYDAFLNTPQGRVRIQIKGRALTDLKKGRVGSIKLDHDWDIVWFVTLSDALELVSVHEAERAAVAKAIARTPSKARQRGALSIREFRRIGQQVWPPVAVPDPR